MPTGVHKANLSPVIHVGQVRLLLFNKEKGQVAVIEIQAKKANKTVSLT